MAGKVAPTKKKKPPPRRKNWSKIRDQFMRSDLGLADFCRLKKLSESTACRYFTVGERNKILAEHTPASQEIRKALSKLLTDDDARARHAAIRQAVEADKVILAEAAAIFAEHSNEVSRWGSVGEMARVAMQAADQLVKYSEELQQFPDEDEDHAWPLTKGFWPEPYQRDFIFDLPSTLKTADQDVFVFAFVGGWGSGKTLCGCEKAGELAWRNRGLGGAILAPTYRMLEDVTKATFFDVLRAKGIGFKYHASDNFVVLFGDTKILFRSMENPDRLKGPNLAWAYMDEGLQVDTREAFDVMSGRIRHKDAKELCLLITGTPEDPPWGEEVLVDRAAENKVKVYHAETDWNPHLAAGYYDRLLGSLDPLMARRALKAHFGSIRGGQAYYMFDREMNTALAEKIPFDPTLPILLMVDFNVAPMCWNIAQEIRWNSDRITYVQDELHLETASTEFAMDEFMKRYPHHKGGIKVYGDPSGHHRHTSSSRSDYVIIEETLKAAKYPGVEIITRRANPVIRDRVLAVNSRLCDAKNRRKLIISRACPFTIRDFRHTVFVAGTTEIEKKKGDKYKDLTHHTDAISYYCEEEFALDGVRISFGGGHH